MMRMVSQLDVNNVVGFFALAIAVAMTVFWILIERHLDRIEEKEPLKCKDCKYFDHGIDEDGKTFSKCIGWVYGGTNRNDFCSHAERR